MGYKGLATAHGFRTVFSTKANETGWNADVIERQLAHEERDEVRGAYNRAQWITERTRLMQWWGDQLDRLRAAGATDTKIGAKNYGRGPHPDVGPQ
jgi:integrase